MTLGEFTGLLLTDFLEARRQADALAAAMSEDYHIDPLMNGIPGTRTTRSRRLKSTCRCRSSACAAPLRTTC